MLSLLIYAHLVTYVTFAGAASDSWIELINRMNTDGVEGYNVGPIIIKEYGKSVTRYLVSGYPDPIKTNGNTATLPHNTAAFVVKNGSFNSAFSPDMYVEYKLLGKTLSFTQNLSQIDCSCNAALFFSSQPCYGPSGQPFAGKSGDYSCNANTPDCYCWEMDTVEANKYALQVTPHQCNASPATYTSTCDGGGCGTNIWNIDSSAFGPDSNFKIDTTKPFRQSVYFGNTTDITLTQGGAKVQFSVCAQNNSYIQSMNAAEQYGMSMILCYWGSSYNTMSWLDGKTGCKGDCPGTGYVTYSDIEIA